MRYKRSNLAEWTLFSYFDNPRYPRYFRYRKTSRHHKPNVYIALVYAIQLRVVISAISPFGGGKKDNSTGGRWNEDKVCRVLRLVTLAIKSQTDGMVRYGTVQYGTTMIN